MSHPPFAPLLDIEKAAGARLLPQAQRKASGHLYKDCPGLDIVAKAKAGKPPACNACLARFQQVGSAAREHQRTFDRQHQEAPVNYAQQAETEIWDGIARQDGPNTYSMPKVDRFEAGDSSVLRRLAKADNLRAAGRSTEMAARSNRFAGSCARCSAWVEANAGLLSKSGGRWVVTHQDNACPAPKPAEPKEPAVSKPGPYRLADGTVVLVKLGRNTGRPFALGLPDLAYLGGGSKLDGAVRLTLEEAKDFGLKTGVCCCCGAILTNPESIALGIGPICRGKHFGA